MEREFDLSTLSLLHPLHKNYQFKYRDEQVSHQQCRLPSSQSGMRPARPMSGLPKGKPYTHTPCAEGLSG